MSNNLLHTNYEFPHEEINRTEHQVKIKVIILTHVEDI